jgi:hypothetical protein
MFVKITPLPCKKNTVVPMNSAIDWAWLGRKALLPDGFWPPPFPARRDCIARVCAFVPVSEAGFPLPAASLPVSAMPACASAHFLAPDVEANGERDNQ